MRKTFSLIVAASLCLPCLNTYAQDISDPVNKVINIPSRYISKIQNKFSHLDQQLSRQTEKYLKRLEKQEAKLSQAVSKYDAKATVHLNDGQKLYGQLINKINTKVNTDKLAVTGEYLPNVDSVRTSLAFLEQNNQLLSASKDIQQKLQGSLAEVKQFQAKLQQTEKIKEYISQRREQMKAMLSRYTNIPGSISKAYSGYSKEAFYYSAQVKEYRDMANDPDKLTKKALSLLDQTKAFQQFAKKYSQLAGLFTLPANYGNAQSLAGLQTRAQVQGMIQGQLASGGPNATAMLTQNLQAAQTKLKQLKDKLLNPPSTGGDELPPGFKPNPNKTKTFLQRLELGTNFQTTRANVFFVSTVDLGLSVAYKLNSKSSIGIGGSAKIGLGNDIRHIVVTGQGYSIRSFAEIKIKGSFSAYTGYEYNYQLPISSIRQLHDSFSSFRPGAPIGISKIVSVKSKVFKKTKLQVLWDPLSYRQKPQGQPFILRMGYNFK
jgi:hypothetical protein